ncbi:hypothetical protein TREMEDRAFT_61529 [Tremella mesenterica DSM 1558]|uniref:uncharacterized protein n=1 Tax=Tremella mesenterica (strain ATCC 24925 / CBS 8224 / DSM 1558 / NBRC 9311 / NRRL Y-6157 / RJB 2259-6 / UBC 559-6) TaxID=578456 RepID=UPI0003F49703|nr:uncharacterized protein TREMEDRAFT_61529 [Tremella mesenterica DSM 1558]EIW69764.1 hypothetical protein TREMEDRAFT_61529 [Tremella mesenterica DSM 1558]
MPRNNSQVSLALSSLTARTTNQEDLDEYILSHLPDEYHEAINGMFKRYLSNALSKLEDDRLMFFSVGSKPVLTGMYQTARQNLIQSVRSYIHGEVDTIFTPESHTSCDVLDPMTGCGKIEYVINDLTTKLGSMLLAISPLSGSMQYQPEAVNANQSRMSYADRYKNGLQLFKSFSDTYHTLKMASRSLHITPENVLSSKQDIINPTTLSKEHMCTESLNKLTTYLEGDINGHSPREILFAAHNGVMVKSGTLGVNQFQGSCPTLDAMGIDVLGKQLRAVQVATSRLELSIWTAGFSTEDMIKNTDGIPEVLSIRRKGKDLLNNLALAHS